VSAFGAAIAKEELAAGMIGEDPLPPPQAERTADASTVAAMDIILEFIASTIGNSLRMPRLRHRVRTLAMRWA
jgi:hypothetical protein